MDQELSASANPSDISAWPPGERPRERLLDKGVQALSDAELLAVLLGTGCGG
ncbi:MAG: putative repair protein, partial [Steroidobacteraceae bacterium]|nr:putative repair protein [Steroidobacteraceae bacterium]